MKSGIEPLNSRSHGVNKYILINGGDDDNHDDGEDDDNDADYNADDDKDDINDSSVDDDDDGVDSDNDADYNDGDVGLGGLGVPCSSRDPRFVGSNRTAVDGFFQDPKILSTSPPGGTLSWGPRV